MQKQGIAFCRNCKCDRMYSVETIKGKDTVCGTEVNYPYLYAKCDVCGAEVYVPDIVDENTKKMLEMYRGKSYDREGRRIFV